MPIPTTQPSPGRSKSRFTGVEIIAFVVLIGTLGVLLAPQLEAAADGGKNRRAIADITAIEADIQAFEDSHQALPANLAAIGHTEARDPWGRAYVYLPYEGPAVRGDAYPPGARRDKLFRPLNSTFDLYSLGKDGLTQPNIDARVSQDDIVRARDGAVAVARSL